MALEVMAERQRAEDRTLRQSTAAAGRLRLAPILGLAGVLRLLAVMLMWRNDPHTWFYNQASELTCLAESVLSGHGLSSPFGGWTGPSAFLAPAYPLLVALIYRLSGVESAGSAAMLTALNVVFGAMTVLSLMLVAKRLFGTRTANLAGALCAISPTMVWLPALFWETSLSTLLLTGMLPLACWCADRPSSARWAAVGAYCGLAMLVNPALLVTFAGIVFWAARRTRHLSWRAPCRGPWLAAATCALLFAAWPIRDLVALHAFVPLRSNLGYELWQGNRPGSQGLFTPEVYLNRNREEYGRYAAMGELPYMHEKTAVAIAAIEADPARFLRLTTRRFAIFWTAMGGHQMSRVVTGEIALTSLCGVAGLVLLLRRRTDCAGLLLIPCLLFPLPYYVTHPDFRFRLLLQPVTLILTAWLLQQIAGHARERS